MRDDIEEEVANERRGGGEGEVRIRGNRIFRRSREGNIAASQGLAVKRF
jgi:hypothetical protein